MKPTRAIGTCILVLLLLAAPAEWLAADTPSGGSAGAGASFPMAEAVKAALEFSSDVIDSRAALEGARLDVSLSALWRGSRLDVKAGVGSDRTGGVGLDYSLQASVPVVTGLSVGGSVSSSSLGASVSYKPFAQADYKAAETLEKALIQVSAAERQAALDARAAYRAAWLAILDEGVKAKALAAAEARSEAASLNAQAGAATSADVIDAESNRIDAMVALLDSKDKAETALSTLAALVGRTVARAELVDPDPGADRLPETKEEYLSGLAGLASQAIDLRAVERAARPEMPDLGLSGSLSQALGEAGATPSWSLSASVAVDPDTFLRGQDQASALKLERARRDAASAKKKAEDDYTKLAAAITTRRSALASANRILEAAKLSWEKNSYLAEAGTVSGASLLDAERSYLAAQYSVAQARAALGAALDALDGKLLDSSR